MLNQRASIFSTQSHSNTSLFYQKRRISKRRQKRTQTSPVNFLDLLNLQVIDRQVLKLLREYLLRRRVTLLSSLTIILLISLNSVFLCVHVYDCRTFNLCSVDDEESKPFFFWILIGLNLTFVTVLVFIVLHLKHCKQYYAENLTKLTTRSLKPDRQLQRTSSEATSGAHSEASLAARPNNSLAFNNLKILENSQVPSISVVHFESNDAPTRADLNKRTCYYDNLAFDNRTFDDQIFDSIELNEMSAKQEATVSAKESYS